MHKLPSEIVLLTGCAIVIISYLFSIVSKFIKVPSVLLLLLFGIILRQIADYEHWGITVPGTIIELFGTIGLVMIVLEAGLDLQLERDKIKLVSNSFFSALIIFLLSAAGIATILY